jgi:4-amino-4-deoxy-L-arabinose transferase
VRMCISLLICIAVFLPWQLYIHEAFPAEWAWENEFNNRHLWEALEGNSGSIFFYVGRYDRYYGLLTTILGVYGIYVFTTRPSIHKKIGFTLLVLCSVVLVFFSVVVQTKMTAFVYCVLPIGFVFAGVGLEELYQRLAKKWMFFIAFGLVILNTAQPVDIWRDTFKSSSRSIKKFNTANLKKADHMIPPGIDVVLNLSKNEHVDLMFYNKRNFTAYDGTIKEEELKILADKKIRIAAFMNHGNCVLPAYVEAYPYLYIIPVALKDLP